MAQEVQISAADHGGACSGEANHRVPQGGGFPGMGGDSLCPEESEGDIPIAGAVRTAIAGPHHQAQAAPLLNGHARVSRHRPPVTAAPETDKGFNPSQCLGIQWDQGRQGTACLTTGKKEQLCGDAPVMDGMRPFRTVAMSARSDERVKRLGRQEFWRLHEGQHSRIGER